MTAWTQFVEQMGIGEIADAIRPYARRCARLAGTEDDDGVVGRTRLGGIPDLPKSVEWPSVEDVPMSLVMQLDLRDVAAIEVPNLPSDGWLWLFVDEGDESFATHRVLYTPGTTRLARAPRKRSDSSCTPVWAPSYMFDLGNADVPELDDGPLEELLDRGTTIGGAAPVWCHSAALDAALEAVELGDAMFHTRATDEMLDEEIDRHRSATPEWAREHATYLEDVVRPAVVEFRRRRREIEELAKGFHTLFLIGSEDDVGWCWGDAGLLEVLIHDDDLLARRFDRTFLRLCSS